MLFVTGDSRRFCDGIDPGQTIEDLSGRPALLLAGGKVPAELV